MNNKKNKYKITKDNIIKVLLTNAKNIIFKNNRAFKMLKKGYNPKSDIVYRSIK